MADARAERHRAVLDALEGRWDEPTAVSTVADAAGLDSATVELMDPAFPTRCWCVWLRCSQAIVEAHRDELADPERGWQVESLLYAHTPEDAATEARRSWAHQLDTDPGNFEVLSVSETRYIPPWE